MKTMMKIVKKLSLMMMFLFFSSFLSINAQTSWTDLTYSENQASIEYNPLKGFVNSNNSNLTNFPTSLQFGYFGLNEVFKGWGNYDWTPVETKMNAALSTGNQYYLRFYIDYSGSPYALPSFLNSLVTSYAYTGDGGGNSPDYNDADLMKALQEFIAAFGAKYNNDPRLAFADIGLVGRWGEWNYNSAVPVASQINQTNRELIFTAYKNAFPNKKIMGRYPDMTTNTTLKTNMGYYDDSFGLSTLRYNRTWSFISQLKNNGLLDNWKKNVNGGEVYPSLDVDDMYATYPYIYFDPDGEYTCNLQDAINQTHATWLRDNSIFTKSTLYNRDNALKTSKLLGYKLYARSVKLTPNPDGTVQVEVQMQNKGIAPFYYDWQIQFAAKNTATGVLTTIGTTDWNISGIIENSVDYLKTATTNAVTTSGTYKILMRVVNPVEKLTTRMRPLRFANSTQDADNGGWLTLGTANVTIGQTSTSVEANTEELSIYPNPVSNILNIQSMDSRIAKEIRIFNSVGQMIYSTKTNSATTQIDVQSLNLKGMIMIQVKSDDAVLIRRVLVF